MDTTETLPVVSRTLNWEVTPKPLAEVNEGLRAEVSRLLEEAQVAAVRHQMAQAFTQMQMMGYSALLNYGVNYQELPAYKDPDGLLEKAGKAPLLDGQEAYFEYMRRVEHHIAAAVRREQFQLRNGGLKKD
ncbi:hypothetical protein MEX01_52890 [Methylorubrum extorquens]|uniref:hypothetical protein n=1 Tax=Methylorubrum extorquens TaxID=408 RepID=UPI00116787E8|nr:hypothetical protein [Methylorubrum extorquens]GEL44698.1 hypothetical protein MEX01_52890 [Methylorubrum extorquens]